MEAQRMGTRCRWGVRHCHALGDVVSLVRGATMTDSEQQADYLMALGERRSLMELWHKLMGVRP